ncbi:unnamed protein product [Rotaria socialis]|uniref:RRM domain-containing protein n=2 Tax=Rotaria socialis TaxID=392032 RepID=A0A818WM23_9BILA|nr:unnamed protein product [Rotaria socialis]CAF3355699.1 unnamed protein product [Rotaria socialis]CAF3622986.1 unnamed protein product [Rotaria socialis]CAF3727391.1 unnamed protein product [Rotaria socialis]CAF4107344.1 unnamed protein product [Rotaria socialis]
MLNLHNGTVMTNNRKLQTLLETKLSTDDKVPKTGRILRNKIFVIGFPPNCTEIDLENFFLNFGIVRETRIVKDENGVTKGYAFITFAKERSVVHALEYRGPLYFMDRKLSINPAIKKQHQYLQTQRCLSSTSISIDSPSHMSSSSNHKTDLNALTNDNMFPISMPIVSQLNPPSLHHYYNAVSQPYFHMNLPSHSIYCVSGPVPIWHNYYSATSSYPSCTYLPMANNSGDLPMLSQVNADVYHNAMMQYAHIPGNNKVFQ